MSFNISNTAIRSPLVRPRRREFQWRGPGARAHLGHDPRIICENDTSNPRTPTSDPAATKIEQIMSKRIATVELDDRIEEVQKIFETTSFHHVLVVEERKLWAWFRTATWCAP